jgi:HlyD family secretion protein
MDRPIERRPKLSRPIRIVGAALSSALIALLLWHGVPSSGSSDIAAADVQIGTVRRADFDDYLPTRATVAPAVTTLVGIVSGGNVESLLVQDGAIVAARQPIAILANPEMRLDVLTREAQIASQLGQLAGQNLAIQRSGLDRTSQIAQAQYDLIKARRELGTRQYLHSRGFLADAGLRSSTEEVAYQTKRLSQLQASEVAEKRITGVQVARLEDTRKRLEQNLAAVRGGLDALAIRAPAGGRLTNFDIRVGQTLKPGDSVGQIDSEGSWKLTADIDEYYLGRVRVGQRATASNIQLTVSKVLPAVKDGRFRIELSFDTRPNQTLNRGQTIDVRITLELGSQALVVPIGGWLTAGGGSHVFVLDEDGAHARQRQIRIGRRNPEQVEILAGLAPGDRIITSDISVRGKIINLR